FKEISGRVRIFQDTSREVVRRLKQGGLASARQMAGFDDNGSVHGVLANDLVAMQKLYSQRADAAYARMEQSIAVTGWLMSMVAGLAVLLAAAGIYIIWRAVARPLAQITRIIEIIAAGGGENGELDAVLPLGDRNDEIGAFARSLAVFRQTMRWNSELN